MWRRLAEHQSQCSSLQIKIGVVLIMLRRHSFIIIDVALKVFFFVFTYRASRLLSHSDFDLLSYFRSTLTMCAGFASSSASLFYLIYSRKIFKSVKYRKIYIITPLFFYLTLLTIVLIVTYAASTIFRLDQIFNLTGAPLFFSAIVFTSMSQLALFFGKAMGVVSPKTSILVILSLFVNFFFGSILIAHYGLSGSIAYISLGYGCVVPIILSRYIKPLLNDPPKLRTPKYSTILKSWIHIRRFLLPNMLESAFSILAPWLAVYFLVRNVGTTGVGPMLYYQAIIGLSAFFIQSIVTNIHTGYTEDNSGSEIALKKFRHIYIIFFALETLIAGGFSHEFQDILNLHTLDPYALFFIYAASLLQSELVAKGMAFKKAGKNRKALIHNTLCSLALVFGSLIATLFAGLNGYPIAVFIARLTAYVYISVDYRFTFSSKSPPFWKENIFFMLAFFALIHRFFYQGIISVIAALLCVVVLFLKIKSFYKDKRTLLP
ncbi:hypothetical protein [Paludibacterium denitrificans]|uniref:hypothetical protein n=1 Tax=Paludibacterium denitrificans TaxID=2675226 RepID=UPI001E2BC204|nr:hypothetical protein [Paludibacterium denitrificans]